METSKSDILNALNFISDYYNDVELSDIEKSVRFSSIRNALNELINEHQAMKLINKAQLILDKDILSDEDLNEAAELSRLAVVNSDSKFLDDILAKIITIDTTILYARTGYNCNGDNNA